MHRDEPAHMSISLDERLDELAALLAAGFLRQRKKAVRQEEGPSSEVKKRNPLRGCVLDLHATSLSWITAAPCGGRRALKNADSEGQHRVLQHPGRAGCGEVAGRLMSWFAAGRWCSVDVIDTPHSMVRPAGAPHRGVGGHRRPARCQRERNRTVPGGVDR